MINKIKNYFLRRKFSQEYQVLDLVQAKFKNLQTILEAGGHNGKDSLRINSYWPQASLYVFEPEPELYAALEKKTKGIANIYPFQFALSDKEGFVEFHRSSGKSDGSSSLLKPKEHLVAHPEVYFEESFKVKAVNLDAWTLEKGIDKIDFMWLDMQGHELSVLKGSPSILAKTTVIYSEVSLIETYEGVELYPEFRSFMKSIGFEVFIEYLTWKDMGNVLFIRKEFI
ncbi:MAG: FkbM family methyltransferase [Crocinitomicaceae bacterium]|jgi:FkbM family methyltransferase|nr:FkbM family methyltransferase [Crocinitomicaceae bacterium]